MTLKIMLDFIRIKKIENTDLGAVGGEMLIFSFGHFNLTLNREDSFSDLDLEVGNRGLYLRDLTGRS